MTAIPNSLAVNTEVHSPELLLAASISRGCWLSARAWVPGKQSRGRGAKLVGCYQDVFIFSGKNLPGRSRKRCTWPESQPAGVKAKPAPLVLDTGPLWKVRAQQHRPLCRVRACRRPGGWRAGRVEGALSDPSPVGLKSLLGSILFSDCL